MFKAIHARPLMSHNSYSVLPPFPHTSFTEYNHYKPLPNPMILVQLTNGQCYFLTTFSAWYIILCSSTQLQQLLQLLSATGNQSHLTKRGGSSSEGPLQCCPIPSTRLRSSCLMRGRCSVAGSHTAGEGGGHCART